MLLLCTHELILLLRNQDLLRITRSLLREAKKKKSPWFFFASELANKKGPSAHFRLISSCYSWEPAPNIS